MTVTTTIEQIVENHDKHVMVGEQRATIGTTL